MKMSDGHDATLNICWWNGEGGTIKRLTVNPGLTAFLEKNPDIFTYGESQIQKVVVYF